MKDDLGGKIMTKFVRLRAKTYSYLIDGSQDKKGNGTKNCAIKKKLKFEKYKNRLEATQFENEINHPEKNKIDIGSLFIFGYKIKNKEFIRNNKLILETEQSFKSERHNVSTEEINKIALSSHDDKRM